MFEDSLELIPAELGLQPNIYAANKALAWTLIKNYPGECSLSSIFFTHPDLDIDHITGFIQDLSGHSGISPSELYSTALRVRGLTLPGQNIEHSVHAREELTEDLFKHLGYGLDALWIATSGQRTGHMMVAIPIGRNYCLWDTRSTMPLTHKWETLSVSDVLNRVLVYHTARRKIEFVRFYT